MTFDFGDKSKLVPVSKVAAGKEFLQQADVYQRVAVGIHLKTDDNAWAVRLSDGQLMKFGLDEEVLPIRTVLKKSTSED